MKHNGKHDPIPAQSTKTVNVSRTSHVQSNEVRENISIPADMPDGMTSPEEQNLDIITVCESACHVEVPGGASRHG
jgi:hypothetical protein